MEEKFDPNLVAKVSRALHLNTYKEEMFKELTGHELKKLTELYQSSGFKPK